MKYFSLILLLMLTCSRVANAQVPPPVDLGIQNISQQTQVWCWVAVVEQIAHWRAQTPIPQSPHQCELVSRANNFQQPYCCNPQGNQQLIRACHRTGHTSEIIGLLNLTSGGYAALAPPTDPMTLYNTLASGRPIIMQVKTSPYAGHVVVLRGMAWVNTPFGVQPVLLINDPLAFFTQPVPFQQLLPYWQSAIVVN